MATKYIYTGYIDNALGEISVGSFSTKVKAIEAVLKKVTPDPREIAYVTRTEMNNPNSDLMVWTHVNKE